MAGQSERRVFYTGGTVVLGLLAVALVALAHEVTYGPSALEQFEYMENGQQLAMQGARFTQLPNYVVTGAVNAPSGGAQAPPGGVAMQFPASNDATDDAGAEEGEGDEEQLTDEEKKIKAEAAEQKRLKRQLDRTKARTYRIRSRMSELRRWIKTQSKEVLTSVAAQTAKLDTRIKAVPGVVGPIGARGKAGAPGKNGLNGAHGAAGGPGPDGEPGEPGTQGEAGPVGPPGVVGAEGEEGPIGSFGPHGPAGTVGGFGPQGEK